MANPKKINPAEAVREIREAAERRSNRTVDLSRISEYKTLFMQCAVAVCPGFTVREEMKPAYNDIVHWAVMDYDGNLDPDKGLLIWGDIGTAENHQGVLLPCEAAHRGQPVLFPDRQRD